MMHEIIALAMQAAADPTTPQVPAGTNETLTKFGVALGGLAAAAYAAWLKFKPDKVADAGQTLDVSALSAGSSMITALQADIARLRDQQSANEKKWQEDMQRLQDRLDAMSTQVEQAIEARRAAEEVAARLRLQVIQLNGTPVA